MQNFNIKNLETFFPKTSEEINLKTENLINLTQENLNIFYNIKDQDRTFNNTARFYDSLTSNFGMYTQAIEIVQSNHINLDIQKAATIASEKLKNFAIDSFSNKKIYQAFKDYQNNNNFKKEKLTKEEQYFLLELNKEFKKEGFDLDDQKFQEINNLKKEIAKLCLDFENNLNQDKSELIVKKEELDGLSENFINSLEKDLNNNFILKTNFPTQQEVLQNCSVSLTREKFYKTFNNKAYPKNLNLLEEIIKKRDLLAKKLGFKTYAHLDIDDEMAKDPETVENFLLELINKSKNKLNQELKLLNLNKNKIKPWDLLYLKENYKNKNLNLNETLISEYFTVKNTLEKIFEIYQTFLNLEFKLSKINSLWAPDLLLLKVFDKNNQELIGVIILDIYTRPNKFPHACMWHIKNKIFKTNGPAVLLIVSNFPKAHQNQPALLKFIDVETFFHEFGHAIHNILGQTELYAFSGTNTKRDFVEMPSQMFEEWLFDKNILKSITKHYKTGQHLPEEIIEKKINLKKFDSGYWVTKQSIYSLLSLYFYLNENIDTNKINKELHEKYLPEIFFDDTTHFQASFGHLIDYSAKYYGYLWSKVYALDIFCKIKNMGLLNPEAGNLLKNKILSKGGSIEPNILIKDFLEREPNQEAFLKDLNLI